jgi:hypothetical protein
LLSERHRGRLAPLLEGLAYRFTKWLPVLAKGRPVFSSDHRTVLSTFFHDCFGGFSQSKVEGSPPWSGSWRPPGSIEPIVDHHIHLVVYSLQDEEAMTCMRQLKWALQQEHVAAQEIVLIEKIAVHLIESEEMVWPP